MPIPILRRVIADGLDSVPFLYRIIAAAPWIALVAVLKWFFGGARNTSERDMHGKVVLVTGGTSGVGEAVVKALASRGAQIVLLTQHALGDPFLVEFIQDVRAETNNQLITAERVDLSSLHSIRQFATKWIDNAPPRRLDMVILCANTMSTAASRKSPKTAVEQSAISGEGVETIWQVNYLSNFHLLSILSPAIRAQPPDRDVRILFGACTSYLGGDLLHIAQSPASKPTSNGKTSKSFPTTPLNLTEPTRVSPGNASATSKLALTTFALAFQKHLSSYARPDKFPMNAKVFLVDPGLCRTPGTRRWLTWGSLLGLLLYLVFYPLCWLVLKSPDQGAQSFLYAAMEAKFSRLAQSLDEGLKDQVSEGGWYVKECAARPLGREDVKDEVVQKQLWEFSERLIEAAEKRGAAQRAKEKKEVQEKKEEAEAEAELRDYKEKLGKKEGNRKEGSRRSRKAG